MRARDRLGRFVLPGDPSAVEPVPEQALPPAEAVALTRALLDEGRAFGAHEVLEACWKAAAEDERDLWQGLAQVCVGLTHLQRGNPVGAATLLRRGAGRLVSQPPAYGVVPTEVAGQATALAAQVEAGASTGWLRV